VAGFVYMVGGHAEILGRVFALLSWLIPLVTILAWLLGRCIGVFLQYGIHTSELLALIGVWSLQVGITFRLLHASRLSTSEATRVGWILAITAFLALWAGASWAWRIMWLRQEHRTGHRLGILIAGWLMLVGVPCPPALPIAAAGSASPWVLVLLVLGSLLAIPGLVINFRTPPPSRSPAAVRDLPAGQPGVDPGS
jgi:hypothetical protein